MPCRRMYRAHLGRRRNIGRTRAAINRVPVLNGMNLYKDGSSASEARQAVGGGRGAVGTGTDLAEAIHRLVLWVGALSTAGAIPFRWHNTARKTSGGLVIPPPRLKSTESPDEPQSQNDANRVTAERLERFQRSGSPAMADVSGRRRSYPAEGTLPSHARPGDGLRGVRRTLPAVYLQHIDRTNQVRLISDWL